MARMPQVGGDTNEWGEILNEFLAVSHNTDGTIKNGITFPAQPERTGQIVMNSVNDTNGFIQKNIIFKDEGPLSRGGPVWVDANNRVQTWLGWHDQIPSGSSHHGLEVKTAADPGGPNSNVLVTRFRIKSDADQTQAAFYSTSMLYIENGIHSPDTQFGITFNTPQAGSVAAGTASGIYELGKLTVNVDGSGVATMDIGAGLDNTTGGRIRIFRDSNVPSANLSVYAADGTATTTFFVDAKTGGLTMNGRLKYQTMTGQNTYNVTPILDGSNHTIVDLDPITIDTTHNASVRMFRNTNTIQTRTFRILKGDGTNTDSFVVNAGTGDVTVTGNLNVSGTISANNFFDELELRRSSNVSTLNRVMAGSNLAPSAGTVYGVLAYAKTAGTFTRIRFCTGTTVTALTEVRLGVYNASNVLLASTANVSATVSAASTLYDDIPLDTPVTTTVGQQLYLALAYTGTALNTRGTVVTGGMAGLAPQLVKTTAYSGGVLPALGSGVSSNLIWIELVP